MDLRSVTCAFLQKDNLLSILSILIVAFKHGWLLLNNATAYGSSCCVRRSKRSRRPASGDYALLQCCNSQVPNILKLAQWLEVRAKMPLVEEVPLTQYCLFSRKKHYCYGMLLPAVEVKTRSRHFCCVIS